MTNNIIQLTNVVNLSTKETQELLKSIESHTHWIQWLDRVIVFTGTIIGILAIVAAITTALAVAKLFQSHKEKKDTINQMTKDVIKEINKFHVTILDQFNEIIDKKREEKARNAGIRKNKLPVQEITDDGNVNG